MSNILNFKFFFINSPLVKGNREQALAAKNYAVISESFASKYFGNEDPMGKTIRVKEDLTSSCLNILHQCLIFRHMIYGL